MKQIFRNSVGITLLNVPTPTIGDKEILVAVEASVISSGTETMGMKQLTISEKVEEKKRLANKVIGFVQEQGIANTIKVIKEKLTDDGHHSSYSPIGYSNAGRIIKKGCLVESFNLGDKVACCGAGIASHTEFAAIPVNLAAKVPENVDQISAAFSTIGSIAIQGLRRANLSFGETVVITGLGLIGLLAVQIAKAWGLVVIGIDLNPQRCILAAELGADATFLPSEINLTSQIKKITNGFGADAVVIYAATKSSLPTNQSFDFCRQKGRVVAVGAIGMELDRNAMYNKELDFVISTSYGPGRYDKSYELDGNDYPIGYIRWTENRNMQEFLRLLSNGKVLVKPLISNILKIEDADNAYQTLIENAKDTIANVFIYNHNDDNSNPETKIVLSPKKISNLKIRLAIIGAGGFVKGNHIPNILKSNQLFELVAISNKTPISSLSAGKSYDVRYVTTDYRDILNDPEIDMILIGTRHDLHAQQVIDCINAKKNVLVEKPLALSLNEIEQITIATRNNPEVFVSVGFNRRYSSMVQDLRNKVIKDNQPIIINYRINGGNISKESWVQSNKEGGGRLIGEACHFIDLISYIANSKIIESNIVHIPLTEDIRSEDNFIITLAFESGSIGVLTYSSIGSKKLPKERLEFYCNNSSAILNDFIELQWFGIDKPNIKLKNQNKGHLAELEEFAKLLNGKDSLIEPFSRDIEISELAIILFSKLYDKN